MFDITHDPHPPRGATRIGAAATRSGRPPEYPWQDMRPGERATLHRPLANIKQSLSRWCKFHPSQQWHILAADDGIHVWRTH